MNDPRQAITPRSIGTVLAAAAGTMALIMTSAPASALAGDASAARHHDGPSGTWNTSRLEARLAPHLLQNGPGRADARVQTLAGPSPTHADITGDGLADLVAQRSGPDAGALRVYDHTGAPGNPWDDDATTTSETFDWATLVILADVTGDGLADVLARDPAVDNGTLWVYPNDASGGSDPWSARFHAGHGWNTVNAIMVGDVTGDGHADLVARNPSLSGGELLVFPNNGSTSTNPWTAAPIWAGTGWNLAQTLGLGDATGDGRLDIVARNSAGSLLVYPHNGATSTNFWTSIVVGSTGWDGTGRLVVTDVTGDGRPDVVARQDDGTLWIHPHLDDQPGRMWSPQDRIPAGDRFAGVADIHVGDTDGDGDAELITRVAPGNDLELRIGDGSSSGDPWATPYDLSGDWGFAREILLADVDGDGLRDLVAVDESVGNGTLWIYPNTGSADAPWGDRYAGDTGWNTYDHLMTGDVTGDGRDDLVGRTAGGALYAYASNGSTTRSPWEPRVWVGGNWQHAQYLTLGDVDGDGVADLVDLESDDTVWLFGTAEPSTPVEVPGDWTDAVSVHLGDVTGSGRLDLVHRDGSGSLWIHAHDGTATGNPWSGSGRQGGAGLEDAITVAF